MGAPGYWMNETSGKLRPSIEALILGVPLSTEDVVAIRDYLRQWIGADWQGDEVADLRRRVELLTSSHEIHGMGGRRRCDRD